jgi:3-hydroxyisobutyrate dehydrogenase-like beta-hydroxyacid dehydrogenase
MSTDEITSSTRLGFIGLGYLGSRIARRLIAAGFPVSVYDRNQAKAAQLSAAGASVAADLTKLAGDVDVVLSCLRDDAAVENVYFRNAQQAKGNVGAASLELTSDEVAEIEDRVVREAA